MARGLRAELDRLGDRVMAEAHAWRVSPAVALWLLIVPIAGALIVALSRVRLSLYDFITAEDSLLEWTQFVLYLCASIFALLVARLLAQEGNRTPAIAYGLLGVASFVVAGEEISWGQRVFGFGTPEGLAEVNRQGETTVHNIGIVQNTFHGIQLLGGLYGSVGAWLIRRRRTERTQLVDLFVPPLFLAALFLVPFGYRSVRVVFFPSDVNFTVFRYGEWAELCFALGLAAFAFLGWRRLRGSVTPVIRRDADRPPVAAG